jgi:hypothetical protein
MMCDSLKIIGSASWARVHRSRFHCAALFLFLLATALFTFGQEATIVGSITDPSGAAVAGAAVTITNSETGQTHHFTTGSEGEFVAPDIRIGHYTVRVEAKGFKAAERKDIALQVGDRARLDFQMQVGTAQETVTVEATAVAVQSDSSEISQVVSAEQLAHLGTNGRSVYTFINLTPGSSSLQGDSQAPTPVGGDANVSFNGNRPVHNLYMLDGGENADRGGGGTFAVMPSVESLAEFRTLTSNYDAEYGLSSAATMTTVLKSGSRTYHASAWEFFRNDALDARNYFNTTKSELRYNIFGFNVGGPIDFWRKEHKSFFFYNMEWRKTVIGSLSNQQVPLASEYPDATSPGFAVFSGNPIFVPSVAQVAPAVLFAGCGGTAPNGLNGSPVAQGSAFNGNAIPDCMIAGNATALLGAGIFPQPNNPAKPGYFTGGQKQPTDVGEQLIRVDHTFNDKFTIFGHFIHESVMQSFATTMWSGDNVPSVGNTFGNPSYSAVVHLIHTIRPNLLNEVAFNYSGNRINILPVGTPALALPSDWVPNRTFTGPNVDNRIPIVNLSTGTKAQYSANWTPWINKYDDYQIRDDISWTRGAHQLKMGASWALYKKIQDVFASTQGNFTFDGSFTAAGAPNQGDSFADYLLGYAQQYQEDGVHDNGYWNAVSWAAYIQDNWRVNKRLTLNLGLRWDGVPHTYEANHRTSNFYPNLYDQNARPIWNSDGSISASSPGLSTSPNPILAAAQLYTNGIGIDGLNGIPKGLVNNHWATFGPRIGFAYDLTGQGKTVIRGGFGIMYERVQGNDMYNAGTNVPFSARATFNNVLLANPNTQASTGVAFPALPIVTTAITGMSRNDYKLPVSTQYSISVQQALGQKAVLTVAYVGNQNRHQSDWREINLVPMDQLPSLVATGKGTDTVTPYDQLVPYQGYHQIRLAFDEGNSHYNSLQTSVRGHVARDLELQAGYTVSKAMDPTVGGGNGFDLDSVSNPYVGWRYDVGPSIFDRRHVAFVNFVYDIPLFRDNSNRAAKAAFGGWQISAIVSLMSGAPINIVSGAHSAASIVPNSTNRPDLTGSISYPHKVGEWFDTSAFTAPVCATGPDCWGNLGHDALRGPGRDNWNMSLFKNFNFTERARLEFRADAFNLWNHTQFIGNVQQGGISNDLSASDFGKVTAAYDPRTLQLGLKLVF